LKHFDFQRIPNVLRRVRVIVIIFALNFQRRNSRLFNTYAKVKKDKLNWLEQ
jgi:hypothetical protein